MEPTQKCFHFALLPDGIYIIQIHTQIGTIAAQFNEPPRFGLTITPIEGPLTSNVYGMNGCATYEDAYNAAQEYVENNGGTMDGYITFHRSNEGLCWICKEAQATVEGACEKCYDEACEAVTLRLNRLEDDACG